MMMISSNKRRSRALPWWALGLVILISIVALWRAPLNELLWQMLAPLSLTRGSQGSAAAQTASTTAALADRQTLYQENLQLKAMLGRNAAVSQVLAAVLERPPQTPYDSLVIDAGTAEGANVSDWVAAAGGAVIGAIAEAGAHTSQVELLSAPGAQYQGILSADDGSSVPVTLSGQGGGSLTAQVPDGTSVKVGDSIAIPGVAEGIEATVSAVLQGEGQSFITLYLELPANPEALQYVLVWQEQSAH
jgi:cell shape-determining protein MreC